LKIIKTIISLVLFIIDSELVMKMKVERVSIFGLFKRNWNFKLDYGYSLSNWVVAYLLHKGPTS